MKDVMSATNIKLFIGVALFATWIALVVFQVTGSEDLILSIKYSLGGLGLYHLNDRTNAPAQPNVVNLAAAISDLQPIATQDPAAPKS